QGNSGAVEIDGRHPGEPIVDRLAGILLHVHAGDARVDRGAVWPRSNPKKSVQGQRSIELRDLTSPGQIRIEIILARKDGRRLHPAAEREGGADREVDRVRIQYGQRARQGETDRTGVGVRRRTEVRGTATEDLGRRLELDM